ncbi:Probable LRR receptor-like serine/threonine-protein kinase RKF3 [Linum perenne]
MSAVHRLLLLYFITLVITITPSVNAQTAADDNEPCPLDFSVLRRFMEASNMSIFNNNDTCNYALRGLRLVQSNYLQDSNAFLPPLPSADSCWRSYQFLIRDFSSFKSFDLRTSCGFQTNWMSQGCINVTDRQEFESRVSRSDLESIISNCNQSLENASPCAACVTALSAAFVDQISIGNVSGCNVYPSIYAAAFVNQFGPADKSTAKCLFSLDKSERKRHRILIRVVLIWGSCALVLILGLGIWILRRKWKKKKEEMEMGLLDAGLVKFSYEDIKKATKNFSEDNIIGKGGFGNVYRGEFSDGSEVAVKRFKNCSSAGDESFAHEVGVIASIRHVNLMALKGYCIATTPLEGHQRIIICELMKNGSLHDHLLDSKSATKLSWPIRQKVALGTARGIAYLHTGAQHAIIHRDIKAHNILLDETFEAKVADFGLAKSNPEGATHLSTKVAGTWGYLAPEYALYGQLTERSDVYSYGVLLLELLSGRKALVRIDSGDGPSLVGDWAWSLVREGRALDVVEDGLPEQGPDDVLERYVMVAILCSHPERHIRPTMEEVVKMLEAEMVVPTIPNRAAFMVEGMDDVEVSMDSKGFSSSSGYHQWYGKSQSCCCILCPDTFLLYAAVTAVAIVLVIEVVPETKCRTLEQIQAAING